MTRTIHHQIFHQANHLADSLLAAIDRGDWQSATELANELWKVGVQSLESLVPRGTVQFAAGDRLDSPFTAELIKRLKEKSLPDELAALILKALGFWAGGEAILEIPAVIQQRLPTVGTAGAPPVLMAGLYAVHLIGGPDAVRVLRQFQDRQFPARVREAAARYLNQLGTPLVDPMFGPESDAEPVRVEEVLRRDRLHDPFAWQDAAKGLLTYLYQVSEPFWIHYQTALLEPVRAAVQDARDTADFDTAAGFLEPTLPQFMLRFHDGRVMVLQPAECFFPARDVIDSQPANLNQWSILELDPQSPSSLDLDGLSLFQAAEANSADGPSVRRALKSWTSQLVSLAHYFGQRRQTLLVFAMAAMQFRTHQELGILPRISFANLVLSLFRSLAD
jgi:hypothetical protein